MRVVSLLIILTISAIAAWVLNYCLTVLPLHPAARFWYRFGLVLLAVFVGSTIVGVVLAARGNFMAFRQQAHQRSLTNEVARRLALIAWMLWFKAWVLYYTLSAICWIDSSLPEVLPSLPLMILLPLSTSMLVLTTVVYGVGTGYALMQLYGS